MLPWIVLVSLIATCAAEPVDCSNGGTGLECNRAPYNSQKKKEVDLEVEYMCKEATRVVLRWRSKTVPIFGIDEYNNYFVNLYLAESQELGKPIRGEFTEPGVPYMKFLDLTPNTTYKFGINLKTNSTKEPMEIISKNTYTTLAKNFNKLPNVTHSSISNLTVYGDEVRTNFSWTPVPENVCSYEIVVINLNGTGGEHPTHIISRPHELRSVEIVGLRFGSYIHVGVYATIEDESKGGVGHVEGKPFWITFQTPHCNEIYGWNYNICKPEPPRNLTAHVQACILDLRWEKVQHPPPFYQIQGIPTNPKRQGKFRSSISGEFTHYRVSTLDMGEYFIIAIAGHSYAGSGIQTEIGVENECTPEEAARPFEGPPLVHYNGTDVHHNDSGATLPPNDFASHKSEEGDSLSTIAMKTVTGVIIIVSATLAAHSGFKYYRGWKSTIPQPLHESCEMAQPFASTSKMPDDNSESGGEPTTEEDADLAV